MLSGPDINISSVISARVGMTVSMVDNNSSLREHTSLVFQKMVKSFQSPQYGVDTHSDVHSGIVNSSSLDACGDMTVDTVYNNLNFCKNTSSVFQEMVGSCQDSQCLGDTFSGVHSNISITNSIDADEYHTIVQAFQDYDYNNSWCAVDDSGKEKYTFHNGGCGSGHMCIHMGASIVQHGPNSVHNTPSYTYGNNK